MKRNGILNPYRQSDRDVRTCQEAIKNDSAKKTAVCPVDGRKMEDAAEYVRVSLKEGFGLAV